MIDIVIYICQILRLVVWIILCEAPEAMNLMGPECASWGVPARGTSKRNFCNAFGAMHLPFVGEANECIAKKLGCMHHAHDQSVMQECSTHVLPVSKPRIVLILFLIVAKHGYFVLEQPSQSLLVRSHRFEAFINHVCYVPWMTYLTKRIFEEPHKSYVASGICDSFLDATTRGRVPEKDCLLQQCALDRPTGSWDFEAGIPFGQHRLENNLPEPQGLYIGTSAL